MPVTAAALRFMRRTLRRGRQAMEIGRLVLRRRREIGWGGVAARAARRLARARPWRKTVREELARYVPPGRGARFDVIYAIGFWPGEPKRYRVFNMAEALGAAGYTVHVMPFERLHAIRRRHWQAAALVLFRAEHDPYSGIGKVLEYARSAGMRIVYDVDDLVFNPDLADSIDALRHMRPCDRRWNIEAMQRRRELMLACDTVTVSTAVLARAVERLGRPAIAVPNGLNAEQLRVAAEIAAAAPGRRDGVVIGYFSGSPTHQRDFAECAPALLEMMERHRRLRFRLVGYLELGSEWDRYRDRIDRIEYLSAADLLRRVAETDINLAPLELGNPFCEAKSELKFFEAALVGVPTVASATETFVDAIEDGVSGFTVRDAEGWRRTLDLLIGDAGRRRAMGEAARARAQARYSPEAITPRIPAALNLPSPRNAISVAGALQTAGASGQPA